MAVKIRLKRMGRRKAPVYAIVATDSRSPRDGRYIEDLGRYYPVKEPAQVEIKPERVNYWLDQGAQPSDTVRSLLKQEGLLLERHLIKGGKTPEQISETLLQWRAEQSARQSKVETKETRRVAALAAEKAKADELAAEHAKLRAEAEAKAAAAAAAAREAADAELAEKKAKAAEVARQAQEEANVAQVGDDGAAAEATEGAVAAATEAAEETVEAVAEVADKAAEAVAEVAEKVAEPVAEVAEEVAEAAEAATEEVAEVAADVAEEAKAVVAEATEADSESGDSDEAAEKKSKEKGA